ncbi:hypothetical protein [Dyadobacter frigoris]|uniref:Uncharacterized protein n=1 Tax=Dyadobacter frigoris TaxID=2576211 RepID=A0A4V6BJA0_9BACT|nr:hypothetical protein [Dyadobacter frigoris]TKT92853.1 hypothetical protein FDK13_08670 [Dyadobacter frigoris]
MVHLEILDTRTNSFGFEIELIRNLIRKKIGIQKVEVFVSRLIIFSGFNLKVISPALTYVTVLSFTRVLKPDTGVRIRTE